MAMQHWSSSGFGLAIVDDELETVRKEIIKKLNIEEDTSCYELAELLQETGMKKGYIEYESTDTASGLCVTYLDGGYVYPEDVLFIYSEKQPNPFKAVYKNIEELVKEFEDDYKDLFPEGFDFKKRLSWFECSVLC